MKLDKKNKFVFILLCCLLFGKIAFSQTIIGEGMSGEELKNYVIENYKTTNTLGYDIARDTLYAKIDLKEGNKLIAIYSGYEIILDLTQDPSSYAYQNGINCEHSWPQSMGASSEPQKSDMHSLYPCKTNVNSSRGNDPFGEIPDIDADIWYRFEEVLYSIPPTNIDEYSEKENDDPDLFEPRESKKGDIARSMFYFFCMYQEAADTTFWNIQKQTFLDWHYYDPADSIELERTWKIADYQDDCPNPFVIDTTLARRIWFYEDTLSAPENMRIDIDSGQIQLKWNEVPGANYYKIYCSELPYCEFALVDSLIDTVYYEYLSGERKFFRVRSGR